MAKNVLRGKNLLVKYDYKLIPLSTSAKITLGTSTVDSTTKEDDEDWDDVDIGSRNWSISADRLVKPVYQRTEGNLRINDSLQPSPNPVFYVGDTFQLIGGISKTITEAIYLSAGDKYTNSYVSTTPPDLFCRVDAYESGNIATVVHTFTSNTPYTVEESGYYFVHHHSTPSHADNYVLEHTADPLADLLADLPLEAPIIVDIDGEQYTGNALITQHDFDGSVKQNQTHSLTLTGTGELTKITN